MTDIRSVDLNLLKALDALLDTRSVTAAAVRLSLTQPTVSGMLARLRETFDDPLFVRAQRGVIPTARAEALAAPLKAALREINSLLQPVEFDPAKVEKTISIAATDYAQRILALPLLAMLRREARGIRLSVRPANTEDLAAELEQGTLDLALTTPDAAPESLKSRRLFDETYVCVLRQGHPATRGPLSLDLFCALDHAIMSHDGTQFRGATDLALDTVGRSRHVVASLPNFSVLIDLLKTSDCCALLPSRLVRNEAGLIAVEPPIAVAGFSKILVWHERTQEDPLLRWIRQNLVGLAGLPAQDGVLHEHSDGAVAVG